MRAPWPAPLGNAALHGLAGDVVRALEPHTEADPAAILFQFLAAFGSAVGRAPHYRVEGDQHHANLFVAVVGDSAKGRKGTSWGRVRDLMVRADEGWQERILNGLSSGEGLIWQVRDPITSHDAVKERGRVVDYQDVVTDPGVTDKRLMVVEGEFASVLRTMGREGNILSATIRNAWDTGTLRTATKNSPAIATNAHVSMIGHVTGDELRRYLGQIESSNGFSNRFLFVCARRSRVLPFGGALEEREVLELADRVFETLKDARRTGAVALAGDARDLWIDVYPELSEGRAGLVGAVTARAEAQVVRLSLLFALLESSGAIERRHLEAGLAAWRYADASASWIFGGTAGNPNADKILEALRRAGSAGMTRTEISGVFRGHKPAAELAGMLTGLQEQGLAESMTEKTAGRPVQRWFSTDAIAPDNPSFAIPHSPQPPAASSAESTPSDGNWVAL